MNGDLSSRERMLAAINCQEPDYVPLCFMIFGALKETCNDQFEFVQKQLELGLDAIVEVGFMPPGLPSDHADLHGLPVRFHQDVQVKEWREDRSGERYPFLFKHYLTSAGRLSTEVMKTDDYPYGDHVPLLDDYLIPRSRKFLVTVHDDLTALQYLLTPPHKDDIHVFYRKAKEYKEFANAHSLLVTAGWGAGGAEIASWLCGMQDLVLLSMDEPGFVEELFAFLDDWNRKRMEVMLEAGVDLFIRRGWYEGTDLWSPSLYRRFIFPSLVQEVEIAHQAGAKFGYIMTSGAMPLLDMLLEANIDVLIGIDPVQGKGTDLPLMKHKVGGKICLWGGVNGFLTVETGSEQEVKEAVRNAVDILSPGGGFILSPVDNVRDTSEETWKNVVAMIDEWKRLRR